MICSISVVIPTCNKRPVFLQEALDSIKNQTYLPEEVIIVNNGEVFLEDIKIDGLNVIVYNIVSKAGVSQARNFGVGVAKSDYVAFLDDDDFWDFKYLEDVVNVISQSLPDLLVSRLDALIDSKIVPYKNAHNRLTIENLLIFNPGAVGTTMVVRKKSFLQVGGFDVGLITSEDKSLVIEFFLSKMKCVTVPDARAIFRSEHGEDRLTDYATMIKGKSLFYKKYKNLMSKKQRLLNIKLIFGYKCKILRSRLDKKRNIAKICKYSACFLRFLIFKKGRHTDQKI